MPPEPITISLSRIFIHGEVSRGEALFALNEKLGILDGRLVECGSALPPTLTESMDIPRACMTTYQWALANVDRAFWDLAVPVICGLAVIGGIIAIKKFVDYADNVGTLTVEPASWARATRARALEETLNEVNRRNIEFRKSPPSRGGTTVEPKFSMSDEAWEEVMDGYRNQTAADDNRNRAEAVIASHRTPIQLEVVEVTPQVTVLSGTSYSPIKSDLLLTEEVQNDLGMATSSGAINIEIDNTTEPKSLVIKLYRLLKRS